MSNNGLLKRIDNVRSAVTAAADSGNYGKTETVTLFALSGRLAMLYDMVSNTKHFVVSPDMIAWVRDRVNVYTKSYESVTGLRYEEVA